MAEPSIFRATTRPSTPSRWDHWCSDCWIWSLLPIWNRPPACWTGSGDGFPCRAHDGTEPGRAGTCAYYQAASFYHGLAEAVRATSPALFDLLEGYCSATFRRFKRELDRMTGQLSQVKPRAAQRQPFVHQCTIPARRPHRQPGADQRLVGRLLPQLSRLHGADGGVHRVGHRRRLPV